MSNISDTGYASLAVRLEDDVTEFPPFLFKQFLRGVCRGSKRLSQRKKEFLF